MVLSLEAKTLAKQVLEADDDARKAQQRLALLKKRYQMGKKAMKSTTPVKTTTTRDQPFTPTKTVVESEQRQEQEELSDEATTTPMKTYIAATEPFKPTKKVAVELQKHHEQEEVSVEATVETRGTGSVVSSNEKRVQDCLTFMGPPPPPPPIIIRAISSRTQETPVEIRDEEAVKANKSNGESNIKTREVVPESRIEEQKQEAFAEKITQDSQQPVCLEEVAKDDLTVQVASESEETEPQVVAPKREQPVAEGVVKDDVTIQVASESEETEPQEVKPRVMAPKREQPVAEEVAKDELTIQVASEPEETEPQEVKPQAMAPNREQPVAKEEVAKDALTVQIASESEETEPQEVKPQVMAPKREPVQQDSTPAAQGESIVEPKPAFVEESPKEKLDLEMEPDTEASSPVANDQRVGTKQEETTPRVQQGEPNSSKSGYFSFDEHAPQSKCFEGVGEGQVGEKSFPGSNFVNETRSLSIVQEASEESQNSTKEEILEQEEDKIKKPEPPSSSVQQTKKKKQRKGMEPNAHTTPNFEETMSDDVPVSPATQQQSVIDVNAMPDMAVSTQAVSSHHHQFTASQTTLQPIDELQQRIAAIPESKDDVPAPNVHEQYHHPGAYDGDDVSVLTEFVYPKSVISPRNIHHQSLAQPITEESSNPNLLREAPESKLMQKTNFFEAVTPRLSNADAFLARREPVKPRDPIGRDPVTRERFHMEPEQLEPDQNDQRQLRQKDPPQFSSRRFNQETGRGVEPAEVTSQPLVKHLRVSSASSRGQPQRQGRRTKLVVATANPYESRQTEAPEVAVSPLSESGHRSPVGRLPQSRAAPMGYVPSPYGSAVHPPIVSNVPQMQHRYITTRSGAASVASYHRNQFSDAHSVMSLQPMGYGPPAHFSGGRSVTSMPYDRTQFLHPSSNVSFREQHFIPSGAASVAPSTGGETVISVRMNARGNKVVTKLVKVEEDNEEDAVVACFEFMDIDKFCGIEFDEQYKVVEEELPPEPLTAANVARNTAMGKKVFNENSYTDPFAGRNDDALCCGLL